MSALVAVVLVCAAAACSNGGGSSQAGGSDSSTASQVPAAYGRACNQAVGGVLPAGWRASGVVVGPLALYSFGQLTHSGAVSLLRASSLTGGRAVKMLALVRPGAVVRLIVPSSERKTVSLAYRPGVTPASVSGGDAAVIFHACPSSSGGAPGVAGWTQFNGSIVVSGARCARFLVASRSGTARFGLAFGRRGCA